MFIGPSELMLHMMTLKGVIAHCERLLGTRMNTEYRSEARKGDHTWWLSDVTKFQRHYPAWRYEFDCERIFVDLLDGARSRVCD